MQVKGYRLVQGKYLLVQLFGHLEAVVAVIVVTDVMLMVTD